MHRRYLMIFILFSLVFVTGAPGNGCKGKKTCKDILEQIESRISTIKLKAQQHKDCRSSGECEGWMLDQINEQLEAAVNDYYALVGDYLGKNCQEKLGPPPQLPDPSETEMPDF